MKIMRILSGAVLATALVAFVSCDGLFSDGEEGVVLQPDEQKEYLETVAVELLEKCPADDMKRYADLVDSFYRDYLEDDKYDFSALKDFSDEVYDESWTEEESEYIDLQKDEYIRESIINLAVVLSNHNGEFTFGRKAVVKDSDNFDGVKVTAQIGSKNYTAELTHSGKVTKATYNYLYFRSEDSDGYWDEKNNDWVSRPGMVDKYREECNVTIDVPEKIEVVFSEEGKPVAKVTITMTKNFSQDGLDPAVDNFNANVVISFDNGYEVVVDKASYDGSKGQAGSAVKFKKDGQALVSSSAYGDAQVINEQYRCEDCAEYGNIHEYTTVKVKKAKNIKAEIDILGKIQVKGACSNAMDANESLDAFWEAVRNWDYDTGDPKSPDEAAALRHLTNLNAKLDCGVYYGSSALQAKVIFEMDKSRDEAGWDRNNDGVINSLDDYIYYDIIPVIVFGDGSRYTVEDYFTKEAFENLIDRIEGYEESYDDLLGTLGFFEKEDLEQEIGGSENIRR